MKRLLLCLGTAFTLASTPAAATGFTCAVTPSAYLGLSNSGFVATQVAGVGVQQVCNVNEASAGISAQVCTAWFSSLLTWRAQGRSGTFYYDSDNATVGGKTACSQFAAWEYHTPYFLQLDG